MPDTTSCRRSGGLSIGCRRLIFCRKGVHASIPDSSTGGLNYPAGEIRFETSADMLRGQGFNLRSI